MSGKEPEIKRVDPMDPTKKNSPIVKEAPKEASTKGSAMCYFNGAAYSEGTRICSGGRLLVCATTSQWYDQGSC